MTIRDLLIETAERSPEKIAVQFKQDGEWRRLSYGELLQRAILVAEVVSSLGIEKGDHVALLMENRAEWIEIYFGLACLGVTVVPVDAGLREGELRHVLRDSRAKMVFASRKSHQVLCEVESCISSLDSIVSVDPFEGSADGKEHWDYNGLLEGAGVTQKAFEEADVQPDCIASIIYTSGTTGRQKGAMLTHANFVSNVDAALQYIDGSHEDNFLLVLPLHHCFAFTGNLLAPVRLGATISLVENMRTVPENMREVSPSILLAVPLLLEKMWRKIDRGLQDNRLAQLMLSIGLGRFIGRKVKASLGGNLRLLIVGGAPCSPELQRQYERLGFSVREGYGLTETSPIVALSPQQGVRYGFVGKIIPDVEVKILDADINGVGEIAVAGPNVMKGYFGNESATREAFSGRWYLTGDLGLVEDGYVKITGRKKSLIVNREGKNIYPEEVEQCIGRSPLVLECLAVGYHDEGETGERVGIIVVPDTDALDYRAAKEGQTLSDSEVVELLRGEVKRYAGELSNYKRPRRIEVRYEEFEKTTTRKIKRYLYALESAAV